MTESMSVVVEETIELVKETTVKKEVEFDDVVQTILYITRGVELNQPRLLQRGIRQNARLVVCVFTSFPIPCQLSNLKYPILYILRLIRVTHKHSVRKLVTAALLSQLVKKYIPVNWPTVNVMNQMIDAIAACPEAIKETLAVMK